MTDATGSSSSCQRAQAYLEDCLSDRLAPEDQRAFWRHTASCPPCLESVLAKDASRVFAILSEEEQGESLPGGQEYWSGFWPAIEAGIRSAPARHPGRARFWSGRRPARVAAAAVLAAAAGLAGLLVTMPRLSLWVPPPDRVAARPGLAATATTPLFEAEAGPWPPTVEQVRTDPSRDVQVYSMTYYEPPSPGSPAGEPPQTTDLILIVDAGLDL